MKSSGLKSSAGRWSIETLALHVSGIVAKESGNILGTSQQSMVISRLKKRLLDLGNVTPDEYYSHLMNNSKTETLELVTLLTTHHTFFFREFSHFDYIRTNLDQIVKNVKKSGSNKIKIWSAACSRGHEVYSLAMFFHEHLKDYPGIDFEIDGSDIDPESVAIAQNGVFPFKEVKRIPQLYLGNNWQRGKGKISNFGKIKKVLRDKCNFKVVNLFDIDEVGKAKTYDIIFCRNVFIYFDNDSITKVVKSFKKVLKNDGLLFSGISESLKMIEASIFSEGPSVYSFKDKNISLVPKVEQIKVREKVISKAIPKKIKVLSVDDSPLIIKIMKKIFESDPDFEFVGSATNGIEAEEFLKNNEVDVMTLDIHMPEMNGLEYLKKNHNSRHPKVVVVSSASREDTEYAQQTLFYGATDFVEKPTLSNLNERAEEIKIKLKMSLINSEAAKASPLDNSFKNDFVVTDCEEKARVFVGNYSDISKMAATIKDLKGDQPPLYILFEGNAEIQEIIKSELLKKGVKNIASFNQDEANSFTKVYICDYSKDFDTITKQYNTEKISFSIYGICSDKIHRNLSKLRSSHIMIEETQNMPEKIKNIANDIFPWTSFAHVGTEYLSKN